MSLSEHQRAFAKAGWSYSRESTTSRAHRDYERRNPFAQLPLISDANHNLPSILRGTLTRLLSDLHFAKADSSLCELTSQNHTEIAVSSAEENAQPREIRGANS